MLFKHNLLVVPVIKLLIETCDELLSYKVGLYSFVFFYHVGELVVWMLIKHDLSMAGISYRGMV